jgi:predicted XRE-type DNA-binding protein
MAKKRRTIDYEASSGNVFADLGLPNPDQELLKANLTMQIFRIINARKLTQARAGKILGLPQPHVSDLMSGRDIAVSDDILRCAHECAHSTVRISITRIAEPAAAQGISGKAAVFQTGVIIKSPRPEIFTGSASACAAYT